MAETTELYNKYRPKKFTDFIGQDFAYRLGKSIAAGEHLQTLLISGEYGLGKTSIAYVIAMALNCPDRDPVTGDPCTVCDSCKSIMADSSFDVISVNAAEDNSVNTATALINTVHEGIPEGVRVYIIDEAHRLTPQAQSAFLGVMERPPKGIVFIMTTTHPTKILKTVVSRAAIRGEMKPIADDILADHLMGIVEKEKAGNDKFASVTKKDIDSIIAISNGSARDAISRLADFVYRGTNSAASGDEIGAIADAVIAKSPGVAILAVKAAVDSGADPAGVAESLAFELVTRAVDDNALYDTAASALTIAPEVRVAAFPAKVLSASIAALSVTTMSDRLAVLEKKIDQLLGAGPVVTSSEENVRPSTPLFAIDESGGKENAKRFIRFVKENSGGAVPAVFLQRLQERRMNFSIGDKSFSVTFEEVAPEDIATLSGIIDTTITLKG